MMSDKNESLLRAVFVHAGLPALAILATNHQVAVENARVQAEVARQIDKDRMAESLWAQWIDLSEDRITAEALVTSERGRGARRNHTYVLGMSGSGAEREIKLFRLLTFLEKVGGLLTSGSVNADDLAGYMREDACRWREHLRDLRNRSEQLPSLDGARFEQLLHALSAVETICGDQLNAALAASMWRPARLIDEAVEVHGRDTVLSAIVRNENMIAAPPPVLRVGVRTHDGVEIGFWLVFPSDSSIPANGEIVVRGRLPSLPVGIARGVTLASNERDFAIDDAARFPNRGGQTWDET